MSIYCIALIKITDRERYGNYVQGFREIFAKYRGKVLSVDEAPTVVEGDWPHTRSPTRALDHKAWQHNHSLYRLRSVQQPAQVYRGGN